MERIGGEVVWEGRLNRVRVDRFRYDDGEEAEREIVEHPGAVGIVAHDGEIVYLVRQPREPVGDDALLELPRASSTRRARSRSTPRSASSPRRSARARAPGST